jgi:hypothetical protein
MKQMSSIAALKLAGIAVVLGTILLYGCHSPLASHITTSGSTVKISFQTRSTAKALTTKTVVPNVNDVYTGGSYIITLHCTSISIDDLSQTVSVSAASDGIPFSSVTPGTWNIGVVAKDGSGTQVGAGTLTGKTIPSGGEAVSFTVPVLISGSQTPTGTGNYSFTFEFPPSSADFVSAQLFTMSNTAVGTAITPTITTDGDTGLSQATVAQTEIASGNYRLALTFKRGTIIAGAYGEAIDVWDNVTSDQWLDSSGNYNSMRTFTAAEFNSSDADLMSVSATESGATVSLSFSSSVYSYNLGVTNSVVVTPFQSADGQKIEYSTDDGGTWITMASGESTPACSVSAYEYLVEIRVTATDGVTTNTYLFRRAT